MKQTRLRNLINSSSDSSPSHHHHHSAPPAHHQSTRPGLDAIHENPEYNATNNTDQQTQPTANQPRFPRSSTVPYPAYATLRKTSPGNAYFSPVQYYYTDYSPLVHETVSPVQQPIFLPTRQPLSLINTTNFQPISPHHHQYGSRPVDVLKPTFLIVPKVAEQKLAAQLSASSSPVPPNSPRTKVMSKKIEKKSVKSSEASPSTIRHSESQTTGTDLTNRHVGLLATPNPSPYVYFGSPSYSTQSPDLSRAGPPESSIMQDEMTQTDEQYHGSISLQSMPNVTFVQGTRGFHFFPS